jgi:hypothetical protein
MVCCKDFDELNQVMKINGAINIDNKGNIFALWAPDTKQEDLVYHEKMKFCPWCQSPLL